MKVEVWSDIVCPWCYIGKRRLEGALADFEHKESVEVVYRAFELDPSARTGATGPLDQRLADKYGVGLEQARAMNQRVTDIAAEEGLTYRLDMARPANTFDAHRLLQLAASEGLGNILKERLMAAYFTEGQAIGDRGVLVALAAEVGIDRSRAEAVLAGDAFSNEVREEEREASELGISGVPFFVLDRRFGVSGAQPAGLLLAALERAWSSSPG